MSKKILKVIGEESLWLDIYDLVDQYDPILHKPTELFDFANPPVDPKEYSYSLIETMLHHHGIGLSSNQVGFPYRVFAMGYGEICFCCFNPELEVIDGTLDEYNEGCLSYPGLFLDISRSTEVRLKFTMFDGRQIDHQFAGLTAKIIQHEMDHLNGITIAKKVSPITLEKAKRKVKVNLKKMFRQNAEDEAARTGERIDVKWQEPDFTIKE